MSVYRMKEVANKEMKTKFAELGIFVLKFVLKIAYFFIKAFPVNKDKVLFCSRQSSETPLDFRLIQRKLEENMPDDTDINIINICQPIGKDIKGYLLFAKATIRSMFHLATSSVCILDSYWPAVSLLKHKPELTIIQIWHAIGKIKKSGYAAIGKKSGRKREYATRLNMHKNYDFIIAGAEAWNRFYCESFGVEENLLLNYGLPRIDYLIDSESDNRQRFFSENPELKDRKIVLYAPTFRRNMKSHWNKIMSLVEGNNILLIIKTHPGEVKKSRVSSESIRYFDEWDAIDLIAVCDYLVTDYSAIALEAAVLNKKTFYWVYDYEEYTGNNGLNIDLYGTVPMHVFEDVDELKEYIEKDRFDNKAFQDFRHKYLPHELYGATEKITRLILDNLND